MLHARDGLAAARRCRRCELSMQPGLPCCVLLDLHCRCVGVAMASMQRGTDVDKSTSNALPLPDCHCTAEVRATPHHNQPTRTGQEASAAKGTSKRSAARTVAAAEIRDNGSELDALDGAELRQPAHAPSTATI